MSITISTLTPPPAELYSLYDDLGWAEFLNISPDELANAMKGSWYVLYARDGERLVGTGRVVSDGVINAYLCGLGVHPHYRGKGIGTELSQKLVEKCKAHNLHMQFFCEEHLVQFYQRIGFKVFAVGMKAAT